MNSIEKYEYWLKNVKDESLLKELMDISKDPTEIENRFFRDLEFGTGGLRGIIGAGSNYMNIYTVGRATQGIADYMVKNGLKTVAVSHDSRNMSRDFALLVCGVFAANGINSYVTSELMPTPFLSFMVRELRTDMGVMVTASHNPAKYNGYKVYGSDGCQLGVEAAEEIIGYVNKVDCFKDVKNIGFGRAITSGRSKPVPESVLNNYYAKVEEQSTGKVTAPVKIVYTALNGAGYKLCPEIMRRAGVKDILYVEEQCYPDGNFTTCPYPNPEFEEALRLALKKLKESGADLCIATDPDADRIGLAQMEGGVPYLFSGNETGILLLDYIASSRARQGTLPFNAVFVKTIVTTGLAEKIAKEYSATLYDVLTGFKYIGGVIRELEEKGEQKRYVMGFEESYGYLCGTYVRDKDAVSAAMLVCEMLSYYKKQGKTLKMRLDEIYAKYGYYKHKTLNYEFLGAKGVKDMLDITANLRKNPIKSFGGLKVIETIDYMTQDKVKLPKENVLVYKLEHDAQVVVRPSGTEPKLKVYLTAVGAPADADALTKVFVAESDRLFKK